MIVLEIQMVWTRVRLWAKYHSVQAMKPDLRILGSKSHSLSLSATPSLFLTLTLSPTLTLKIRNSIESKF